MRGHVAPAFIARMQLVRKNEPPLALFGVFECGCLHAFGVYCAAVYWYVIRRRRVVHALDKCNLLLI